MSYSITERKKKDQERNGKLAFAPKRQQVI